MSKRSGQQCRQPAMHGTTVCYMHGGKTPSGIAAPAFKSGRYSKHLPSRLIASYEAAQQDADLLNLNAEIALIDARLVDVLGRVDTGESGKVWRDLKETFQEMRDAFARRDTQTVQHALTEMGRFIDAGHADYAAWADVRGLVDQRRKLVQVEARRRTDMQQMLTAEQAMVLLARVTAAIKAHVSDPASLAAIAAEFGRIVDHDAAR
jgi:hypothetical protein